MQRFHNNLALILAAAMLAAGCSEPAGGQARRAGGGLESPFGPPPSSGWPSSGRWISPGRSMSPDQARVSAEAAGIVRQVLVEIGREVRVGDPLVRLGSQELSLALARAESALRQTRAQLGMHGPINTADTPPPDDEIGSVRNALANREDARASSERAKTLAERGILSPVDLQAADTRLKVAEAAYQSAIDNVRGQKALLQDRRAAYDLAAKQLADAVVRAPIAGVVSERLVQVGEYIGERTPVATIVQVDPLKLRTGVQERHAGIIQPGQAVEFRVESFGDVVFTRQGRLRQPVARPDDAHVRGRSDRRTIGPPLEARLLRQGRDSDAPRRGGDGGARQRGVHARRRLVGLHRPATARSRSRPSRSACARATSGRSSRA